MEDKKKRLLRENARLEKWNNMLTNFEQYKKNNFSKLKQRTRKGVPDSLRGLIWQLYAKIDQYRNQLDNSGNDSYSNNIFNTLVNEEECDLETESYILRDIDRTFPKHSFFKDKYGLG